MKTISFVVYGVAQPAGSKRGFAIRRGGVLTGGVAISDANPKSQSWKQEVSSAAVEAMRATDGYHSTQPTPIRARFTFKVPRPKGHFRKNGALKEWAISSKPSVKPDVLKLARGVEDACSKICYQDDAQITTELLIKRYCAIGEAPHVLVEFTEDTE